MRTPARLALMLLALLTGHAPAQYLPGGAAAGVQDPATPVVRIQVRAPAFIAPGKPLVYRLIVTNTSAATAYKVVVRHPFPAGVAGPPVPEPKPETPAPPATAYEWKFAEMRPGAAQEITLTYTLKPEIRSVEAKAFVTFEHGQVVTTTLEEPKVKVTKVAPEKALGTQPFPVRLTVSNTSNVPVRDIQVVEAITEGFEFVADAASDPADKPTQRTWRLKLLGPGQSQDITYRVRAKPVKEQGSGMEIVMTSNVTGGSTGVTEPVSERTRILRPALQLAVTGPPTATVGEPAEYTVEVTNTGNTPLSAVRVSVDLPPGATFARPTRGSQPSRDGRQRAWDLPPNEADNGPLAPGQVTGVKFTLIPGRVGEQRVTVHADGGRGVEDTRTATTAVAGAAALRYDVELAPGVNTVGLEGQVKYTVTNNGTEAAKGVVLRVKLPPEVEAIRLTPDQNADSGEVVFGPRTVLPDGGTIVYTITYKSLRAGRAEFTFSLTSDRDREPLQAAKHVTIGPARE